MSGVSAFSSGGKALLYLINHDPIEHVSQLLKIRSLGKFVAEQTIREFRAGGYNDFVLGELFDSESIARQKLYSDEYYIELSVPTEAILSVASNGHVLVKSGYTPKILALKTLDDKIFYYDDQKKIFYLEREKDVRALTRSASRHRSPYHHHPKRWFLTTGSHAHSHS